MDYESFHIKMGSLLAEISRNLEECNITTAAIKLGQTISFNRQQDDYREKQEECEWEEEEEEHQEDMESIKDFHDLDRLLIESNLMANGTPDQYQFRKNLLIDHMANMLMKYLDHC